jgi:hypothetical protein
MAKGSLPDRLPCRRFTMTASIPSTIRSWIFFRSAKAISRSLSWAARPK